eukprot:1181342-Prorocentrum_minimum.AAC.6
MWVTTAAQVGERGGEGLDVGVHVGEAVGRQPAHGGQGRTRHHPQRAGGAHRGKEPLRTTTVSRNDT